jgi:hypothetical protein
MLGLFIHLHCVVESTSLLSELLPASYILPNAVDRIIQAQRLCKQLCAKRVTLWLISMWLINCERRYTCKHCIEELKLGLNILLLSC